MSESNKQKRNPKWSREELILALDLYFRHSPSTISQDHESVIELSNFLDRLGKLRGQTKDDKFRNTNGVYMKLCNFLRFDPSYSGTGLQRGGKLEEEIWKEFAESRSKLQDAVTEIKASVSQGNIA